MFNYRNLSDYDFELLCRDIMEKKLSKELRCFAPGRDGGVDITEKEQSNETVIQVKHYLKSSFSQLKSSLKKELPHVRKLNPTHYYVCCAKELTADNINEIYGIFSDFMDGPQNVIDLEEIDRFLHEPENADVLEKHFKLWLESVEILEQIFNQDVFVDCESLLDDVEREQQKFVKTGYYEMCRNILEKDRMILLLGNPGVGKTMTSKMLALYFAANGYRIRYTTNNDLSDLKASLSREKDRTEVLLLDDCLGQHYFRMQETKERELLALMRYIRLNPKKILIMNSRVTIFKEAKERSSEFRYFLDDEKLKIRTIEMTSLSREEKGQIFYNHLYFSGIPDSYWQDIKSKKSYRQIAVHPNYTPRLMEFVTKKSNYGSVKSGDYSQYILDCLDNPKELWKDEFCRKIAPQDRALMLTLYSLTDTMVEDEVLRRAYAGWIEKMPELDRTRNIYEESLKRLTDSMLKIIEDHGVRKIGVSNPSVNDFLKNYVKEQNMQEHMTEYATEYTQLVRSCPQKVTGLISSGEIYRYHFSDNYEKMGIILSCVCRNQIKADCHRALVYEFLDVLWCFSMLGLSNIKILITLLTKEFDDFYHTRDRLTEDILENMLMNMSLEEFDELYIVIKEKHMEAFLKKYQKLITAGLQNAADQYISDVSVEDYCGNYDISKVLENNTYHEQGIRMPAFDDVAEDIAGFIRDDISDEVWTIVNKYPAEISCVIEMDEEEIDIDTWAIEQYLTDWCRPDFDEGDIYEGSHGGRERSSGNILDIMFQ